MTAYKQVVALLGKDPASLLKLLIKLFVDSKLDFQKFLHMLQNLKKEHIIGLMDGTYEVVKKKMENTKSNLFIFSNFFFTKPGLYCWDTLSDRIGSVYTEPKEYESINDLKPAFDLDQNMYDSEIMKKLGGEEKVRETAVTIDQIEQLIKNQWDGKAGIMLNNSFANIFYVIGKNNQLFAVRVVWRSDDRRWRVGVCALDEDGSWLQGRRVFSNKNFVS
ncbi:MAG: hypothetical protein QG630_410 [Patescibacteria group bacterium]|nr:hypothetical protein [Patescibacteria group bacterium]